MAKRRRKKPNIPQSAMEHARQELGQDEQPSQPAEDKPVIETKPADDVKPAKAETTEQPKQRRRRRNLQAATLEKRKNADSQMDGEFVAEMLANPTKVVTEEDLKADYGFVIKDLRNMGILAAVLFVFLVGTALVIL